MRQFFCDGVIINEGAPDFAQALTRAYRAKQRPLCLCKPPGLPMYIAEIGDQLVIKRIPLSGSGHAASCSSYEPPYELSGLGALMGSAIKLDVSTGLASLRLDFALSKRSVNTKASTGGDSPDSVKAQSGKMSLRALLHFLWHESGLTEWTAHWAGKRHWWHVYHHLLEASRHMTVRGECLADRLLVPEPFKANDKQAIEQRRAQKLAALFQSVAAPRKLMVLVAEIKEFAEARSGRQIVVKQMPGLRLHLDATAWTSLQRRFDAELTLWQSSETSHLMMIATIDGSEAGVITIQEMALMTVTEHWLPIENVYEQALVERLARLWSKSVKGLRFNLSRDQPLANAITPDLKPSACALYIVPPGADQAFETTLEEMIKARPDVSAWIWRVADGDMPNFPR